MKQVRLGVVGYEGTERLKAVSPADALKKAALYRKIGTDFALSRQYLKAAGF